MNIVSLGITAASLVTGLAGAGVAYELATVDSPQSSASAPATPAADPAARGKAGREVRFKPCRPPAVREGRACVTEEVRTVRLGSAAAAGARAAVRRDDDFDLDDLFDDHGGDRDDFDFDDLFDDHGGDRDDFDDDSSGHGSGHDDDDDDDDDSSGHGSGHDDDDDDWDDDDDDDDWDDD